MMVSRFATNNCRIFKRCSRLPRFFMSTIEDPVSFGKDFYIPDRLFHLNLEKKNPHPLDARIQFIDEGHKYLYDGKVLSQSVTGLVKSYSKELFDSDVAIKKMFSGKNWPKAGYIHDDGTPYNASTIKQLWETNNEVARNKGSWMHHNIESLLNGLDISTDSNKCTEINQFRSFYEKEVVCHDIIPFRTEWRIAAPDLSLGGSVDFVGKCKDGTFALLDWKRSDKVVSSADKINYAKSFK